MSDKLDDLLDKLAVIERDISAEKGELTFFGLLKRWSPTESWILIVSSSWSDEDEHPAAIDYIVDKYYAACDDAERVLIARVAIVDTDDDALEDLLEAYDVEHGRVKIRKNRYFDEDFERGYIFTCQRRTAETSLPEPEHATGQPS